MQYCDYDGRKIHSIGLVTYVDADPEGYDGAYRVYGASDVAWRVLGWQVERTESTDWDGMMARTGALVVVMIGDDRPEIVDVEDVAEIDRSDFCGACGQIGCGHDGLERD